jgi:hypothetical protein
MLSQANFQQPSGLARISHFKLLCRKHRKSHQVIDLSCEIRPLTLALSPDGGEGSEEDCGDGKMDLREGREWARMGMRVDHVKGG